MPAILLTPANFSALKTVSRRELPTQGSGHLTEVLAVGAGFNTHAALLKAMNSTHGTTPALIDLDLSRMSARLSELAGAEACFDFLAGAIRSPGLPERIWAKYQTGEAQANSTWFQECRRRGIPMVFIEMRRKYVRLNWDCITVDAFEDEAGKVLGAHMFKTFQAMAKGAEGNPFFDASAMAGHVDRLSPELAYNMADTFFGLLYRPKKSDVRTV